MAMNFNPLRDAQLLKEKEEREENLKKQNTTEDKTKRIAVELKIEDLIPSKKNIFHRYNENERQNLKESIERIGLQNPIIVRTIEDGKYEILSGENRVEVFKELEKETIPAFIIEADDDTAELILIDTNIVQRGELTVMERAKIYKQKQTIEKRKNYNLDIINENLTQEEQEILNSDVAKQTYYRYLSLNNLIPEFQKMCEENEIQVKVGEQISKITADNQKILFNILGTNKINEAKAIKIKQLAINTPEEFTEENVRDIIFSNKSNKEGKISSIKFTKKELEKYFYDCETIEQIKQKIFKILEEN